MTTLAVGKAATDLTPGRRLSISAASAALSTSSPKSSTNLYRQSLEPRKDATQLQQTQIIPPSPDQSRLAPEDALYLSFRKKDKDTQSIDDDEDRLQFGRPERAVSAPYTGRPPIINSKKQRRRERQRERSRGVYAAGQDDTLQGTGAWKKLLWVKQDYPDNYTDAPTFLSHLQRNPRLRLYDFWPLVADSTIIVQHVCSVAIFICCFIGIYQERVDAEIVVGWSTGCAVLGWILWDIWSGREARSAKTASPPPSETAKNEKDSPDKSGSQSRTSSRLSGEGFAYTPRTGRPSLSHSSSHLSKLRYTTNSRMSSGTNSTVSQKVLTPRTASGAPTESVTSSAGIPSSTPTTNTRPPNPAFTNQSDTFWSRMSQRLSTAKSAVLIYCALLGLSPILKSLTRSTSSDSIWAISSWLMLINVFFFDYGGSVGDKFPASMSTNAALMASTVLASRLTLTTHVFSLTVFSIEVFGLFPVFRRHVRHQSWALHVALTTFLIIASGAGLGLVLVTTSVVKGVLLGVVLWSLTTMLAMGGTSWWLIGLQRYKNVVIGPWDTARPIIRAAGWE